MQNVSKHNIFLFKGKLQFAIKTCKSLRFIESKILGKPDCFRKEVLKFWYIPDYLFSGTSLYFHYNLLKNLISFGIGYFDSTSKMYGLTFTLL